MPTFAVILAAGGSSSRFGTNKLLELIGATRVIDRAIAAFASRDDVVQVIVAGSSEVGLSDCLIAKLVVTPGGTCRAHTVALALQALKPGIDFIAVHDAARPLVSQAVIDRVFAAAVQHGAAIPAVKLTSTIKRGASNTLPTPIIATENRDVLFAVQTPQACRADWLRRAYEGLSDSMLTTMTDEAMLLEHAGRKVMMVEGDEANIKITRPIDLTVARALLNGF